jgi:2-iminobutanoate/2-iminopropanoate deaminase
LSNLQRLNPSSAFPPAGTYSQLSITSAHARIATFSGQIGLAHAEGTLPQTAAEQTRLVFDAIEALLTSQGATPADLVRLMTMVVGRDNLAEFNTVRTEVYRRWFPDGDFPVNTVVLVAGLAVESILVEIEGSFVCPS